jgi:tRNA G10  N-methylase Trm11
LKLARSMLNLTDGKQVWDPFCGAGRITASTFDKERIWLNSDRDEECVGQVQKNWEYVQKYKPLATLQDTFKHDVTRWLSFSKHSFVPQTIVTEGYLGKNFSYIPQESNIRQQYDILVELWTKALGQIEDYEQISELVFCLPFYPSDVSLSRQNIEHILRLCHKYGWEQGFKNSPSGYVVYGRSASRVKHAILNLKKVRAVGKK